MQSSKRTICQQLYEEEKKNENGDIRLYIETRFLHGSTNKDEEKKRNEHEPKHMLDGEKESELEKKARAQQNSIYFYRFPEENEKKGHTKPDKEYKDFFFVDSILCRNVSNPIIKPSHKFMQIRLKVFHFVDVPHNASVRTDINNVSTDTVSKGYGIFTF